MCNDVRSLEEDRHEFPDGNVSVSEQSASWTDFPLLVPTPYRSSNLFQLLHAQYEVSRQAGSGSADYMEEHRVSTMRAVADGAVVPLWYLSWAYTHLAMNPQIPKAIDRTWSVPIVGLASSNDLKRSLCRCLSAFQQPNCSFDSGLYPPPSAPSIVVSAGKILVSMKNRVNVQPTVFDA
ncbi:hypothetical protein CC78DRAFT_579971 [Lojkania enalia]|uniref:Uncharacterized protein n=1 Tax=Lojkania enalia TaxID=147567 RepID=A0A9P4N3S0_9PLEO|nr:hypothetical protein CC78DRAFT_579971 [Didymosphaeria enalia]